ncbi:MAG: hypothetical protein HY726_10980 [Candidatus Rokubacteria bacterium]|nr:hypothetical protein [Candidatus Rokubacteria bacterium]
MERRRLILLLALAAGLALAAVGPAWAQQVEIVAPPPERVKPPELVLPGQPPQITHPRESDFTPDNVRTRHDPAFIAPFTTTVRTGPNTAVRFGLSGWTAPPVRRDVLVAREHPGWFALGFTVVWDVPVEPPKPRASSAPPAALR